VLTLLKYMNLEKRKATAKPQILKKESDLENVSDID
jgi:hypothetical protein